MLIAARKKSGAFASRPTDFRHLSTHCRASGLCLAAAVLAASLMLAAGCQAPAPPTGPTERIVQVPDREAFIESSLSVLRRHDFPPEFVDRSRGMIITRPATSGQWFEFWRIDARGGYQTFESSIHTLRRVVTVNIEPTEADDQGPDSYRLQVQVDKSRYSAPERQVTTASGAMAMFSTRLPTTTGLRQAMQRYAHWVPLGRDPLLEAYLLDLLVEAIPPAQAARDPGDEVTQPPTEREDMSAAWSGRSQTAPHPCTNSANTARRCSRSRCFAWPCSTLAC